MWLPTYSSSPTVLEFMLAHGRPKHPEPLEVEVMVNGERRGVLSVSGEWERHQVVLDAGEFDNPTVRVELRSAMWDPAEFNIRGFPDALGVMMGEVAVYPQPASE